MAVMVILRCLVALSLLMHCCWGSVPQTGCMKWTKKDSANVCCEICHPGHHLAMECGPDPETLCVPCEPGRFTVQPNVKSCAPCTQCVGVQVQLKACNATSDTQCGCKKGFLCETAACTACVKQCGKGQQPKGRSCISCPDGTFNDQVHQMCKPWSTKCPGPDQVIITMGDAFTDIKCVNVSVVPVSPVVPVAPVVHPEKPDLTEKEWPLILAVVTSVVLVAFSALIIILVVKILLKKRKSVKKTITKTQIIRTPTDTDDPRTLIAVECSFHEAQQEQGSSLESLNSKDSSEQLIA